MSNFLIKRNSATEITADEYESKMEEYWDGCVNFENKGDFVEVRQRGHEDKTIPFIAYQPELAVVIKSTLGISIEGAEKIASELIYRTDFVETLIDWKA